MISSLRTALTYAGAVTLLCTAALSTARAQAPSIASAAPQAARPGATVEVTLRGGNLAGATQLWTSFPAEAALSPDVKDNGKDNAQVVYRLSVSEDALPGVHGIRVASPRGVSSLRLFVIDELPSLPQEPENKSPETAQQLSIPTAVDGTVNSLNRHYFRFPAKAGQRLSFEVLARRIGSPLDPIITVFDPQGREVFYSDDAHGLSGDPQISHIFEESGDYLLELHDIRYEGGGNHSFRLRIGDFPCVNTPFPLAAQRGTDASLTFAGSDVDSLQRVDLRIPDDPQLHALNVGVRRAGGTISGFGTLVVSPTEEVVETEPNDSPEEATKVNLGADLNGRFNQPRDVDHYTFSAKKGQKFTFQALTRQLASPSDLVLRLFDASGKKLSESEDAGNYDSLINNFTFPADGDYVLSVEDLNRRGGSEFSYRIGVRESISGFTLSASTETINVPAGGTASLEVKADRNAYNGPIEIVAVGLPEGITSRPTVIGPGLGSVLLTLTSAPDAPAGQIFPVRIVGTADIGDSKIEAAASVTDALKDDFSGMPWPPLPLAHATAASLAPQAPFSLKSDPAKLVIKQKGKASVKITLARGDGIDEEVTLALNPLPKGNPNKGGLPGGLAAAFKPIPKGQNEVTIEFSANEKVPPGRYTATLVATHKKGDNTLTQPVPGILIEVQTP